MVQDGRATQPAAGKPQAGRPPSKPPSWRPSPSSSSSSPSSRLDLIALIALIALISCPRPPSSPSSPSCPSRSAGAQGGLQRAQAHRPHFIPIIAPHPPSSSSSLLIPNLHPHPPPNRPHRPHSIPLIAGSHWMGDGALKRSLRAVGCESNGVFFKRISSWRCLTDQALTPLLQRRRFALCAGGCAQHGRPPRAQKKYHARWRR